jgi:5-formyltetrahydrofolate cyclo-ligase
MLEQDHKKQLRQHYRAERERLSNNLAVVSAGICEHLRAFIELGGYQTVLAYRAFGSEVVLDGLVTALPLLNWLCPRIDKQSNESTLTLHHWSAATKQHRWGLFEPIATAPAVAAAQVDLVLVPGLVFGLLGERLGYGRGHYDRLLAQMQPFVPRIGIVRQSLIITGIPMFGFDVPMTHLATETGVFAVALPVHKTHLAD